MLIRNLFEQDTKSVRKYSFESSTNSNSSISVPAQCQKRIKLMKIYEVTNTAKVSRVTGNTAEIDHGDGTKTVVDLQKNPDALTKDSGTGRVRMNKGNQQGNSMGSSNSRQRVRPGDTVELPDED